MGIYVLKAGTYPASSRMLQDLSSNKQKIAESVFINKGGLRPQPAELPAEAMRLWRDD